MVIAPPSVRKDGSYRWLNDLPVAEAPPWLIKAAREKPGVPEHLKDYKSNGVGAELFGLPGRTDNELIALLEASSHAGQVAQLHDAGDRHDDRARLVRPSDQARLRAILPASTMTSTSGR